MAEPKLQIDQRLDRIEAAIEIMANRLVRAETGFDADDAEDVEKTLRGEEL